MIIYYRWAMAVLLLSFICALYGQFLWNPIVFDDLPFFLVNVQGYLPVENYQWSLGELRSLPYATLNWTAQNFGLDMLSFRVENMLLHGAVTIALFFFLQTLANHFTGDVTDTRIVISAFLGALVFALNPVAVYAVAYLVQRSIVMSTLFSLLAIWAYAYGSLKQKRFWLWLSVPFYYLAVFSKEHAIMLPMVLIALTVLLHENWRSKLRQNYLVFIALAFIAFCVLLAKIGIIGSVYEVAAAEMVVGFDKTDIYPLSVLTQSWLFFKYLLLWLLPNPLWLSVDMREPFPSSLMTIYWGALTAYFIWGGFAVWLLFKRNKYSVLGFAMFIPWVLFMTEFSAVRIQESMVLYRSYLWMIGIPIAVMWLALRWSIKTRWGVILLAFLVMFPISMERLSTFSHPFLLWDDASRLLNGRDALPGASRIYNNRGNELLKIGRYDEAIIDLKKAISLTKNLPSSHNNLGVAYLKQGKFIEAREAFNTAIEIINKSGIESKDSRPFRGRAMAYEALGEYAKARDDYTLACQLAAMGCEKIPELTKKIHGDTNVVHDGS